MKTQEEIKKDVLDYINKTSNHLFVTKSNQEKENTFMKLFPFEQNGKQYFMEIVFTTDKVISVYIHDIDHWIKWHGVNTKDVLSKSLFLNKGYHSVKHFNKVKAMFATIRQRLNLPVNTNPLFPESVWMDDLKSQVSNIIQSYQSQWAKENAVA